MRVIACGTIALAYLLGSIGYALLSRVYAREWREAQQQPTSVVMKLSDARFGEQPPVR